MDAILLEKIGSPVRLGQRPIPEPEQGEVRLRVATVGLNPYDHRARDWGLFIDASKLPYCLGNDIVGRIEKFGPNTEHQTDLAPGDLVFGQSNHLKGTADQCGLQTYCILDVYSLCKVPAGFTSLQCATIPNNAVAAYWALFNQGGFGFRSPAEDPMSRPGNNSDCASKSIAIVGAGSNCGRYAIQFAALAGFKRIIAVASTEGQKGAQLLDLGASHVVERKRSDEAVVQETAQILEEDELLYVLDCWNLDLSLAAKLLSPWVRGTLVSLVPGEVKDSSVQESKEHAWEYKFSQGASHNNESLAREFWNAVPIWLAKGWLTPTPYGEIIEGLDSGRINETLDRYRDGQNPECQVLVSLD